MRGMRRIISCPGSSSLCTGCRSSFPVKADLCSTIEPDTDLASCPNSVFIDSGSREGQCSH